MSRTFTPARSGVPASIAVAAVALAACGDDTTSATASAPRTVEIEMSDIAYSPDEVDLQAGETVRFVVRNKGAVTDDAFIGDEDGESGAYAAAWAIEGSASIRTTASFPALAPLRCDSSLAEAPSAQCRVTLQTSAFSSTLQRRSVRDHEPICSFTLRASTVTVLNA